MRIGDVDLSGDDLATHIRIMGRSGQGKSTLLYSLLTQIIMADGGFALLDPHGELYGQLLSFLAYVEYRKTDVKLIDATQRDTTATVNPFTSQSDADTIETKAQILADLTLQVWGKESEAVRADKILYLLYVALLEQKRPLSDALEVLVRPGPIRNAFARGEWSKIKPSYLDSVMTRLQPLTHSRLLALTNPSQAINFPEIIDGKILLANLARSAIMGERECRTLSAFLVAELWSAAFLRRERHPPFYLVIDEFSTLATRELASVLTQAQKFGLHLIFLHQDEGQLPSYLRDAIGNVSCFIEFIGKGQVRVTGWKCGEVVTMFEPELVPEPIGIDQFRAAVAIPVKGAKQWTPPAPVRVISGKGGIDHKNLQSFIVRVAEPLGLKATIEKAVEGGHVDVLLEGRNLTVACEVSVRSTAGQEEKNVAKCIGAGFTNVIVLVADHKRVAGLQARLGVTVVSQTGFHDALTSLIEHHKPSLPRVDSKEACKILGGINLSTLYRRVANGTVPAIHPPPGGRGYKFERDVLEGLGKKSNAKAEIKLRPVEIDKVARSKGSERYRKMLE